MVTARKSLTILAIAGVLFLILYLLIFGNGVGFWVAVGVVSIFVVPFLIKVVSKSIFISYFETKKDFYDTKKKEE